MKCALLIYFSAFGVLCFTPAGNGYAQTPANDPHWELLWRDEFDGLDLDPNRWIVANDCDHGGDPQLYIPEQVSVLNGSLKLTAEKRAYTSPSTPWVTSWSCGSCLPDHTYSYVSGWVESRKDNTPVNYGYIEARIRMSFPFGDGLFPAFWMWTGQPSYQEIDIFEFIPGHKECLERRVNQRFYHNVEHGTSNLHFTDDINCGCEGTISTCGAHSVWKISDYRDWHTYGIEWSPTRIIWYLDDVPIRYSHNNGAYNSSRIIFSLAIQRDRVITGAFPSSMFIDYIATYTMKRNCDDYINTINYDFSNYASESMEFIKIGGYNSSNETPMNSSILIRASSYIEINGEFAVPLGSALYLDADGGCNNSFEGQCTEFFNPCVYDFEGYNNDVKKRILLGGTGCNMTIIPASSALALRSTTSISIDPGVTVSPTLSEAVAISISTCP